MDIKSQDVSDEIWLTFLYVYIKNDGIHTFSYTINNCKKMPLINTDSCELIIKDF